MNKLLQITEGYTNLAKQKFGVLSSEIEALGKSRAAICANCPLATNKTGLGYVCDSSKYDKAVKDFKYGNENRIEGTLYEGCSCVIESKILCTTCACPLGKW